MRRLTLTEMERARLMHGECMEDPEYAAKWNALVAQLTGVPLDIPDEARGDSSALTGKNGGHEA